MSCLVHAYSLYLQYTIQMLCSFLDLLGTSPHTVAAGDLVDGDNRLEVTATLPSAQTIGPLEVNCQRTTTTTAPGTTTIAHSGSGWS